MANEIVVYSEGQELAKHALQSRIFGLQSMDEAIVKYAASKELGIGYTAGLEYLQVIQGKLTITPRGMLALALKFADIKFEVTYDYNADGSVKSCTVEGYRKLKGETIHHTETFSMADAKAAGLLKDGGNWSKYPKKMLQWRAMGFWLDVLCPDVMFLKRQDEFTDRFEIEEVES